jgi:hypothetical protein
MRGIIVVAALAALAACAADGKVRVMNLSFTRSGGLFAGKVVEGRVNLDAQPPEVTSPAGYRRELTPDEIPRFRGLDVDELATGLKQIQQNNAQARDIYQYEVTVTTGDGKTRKFRFNSSGATSELRGVPAPVADLVQWLRKESQSISTQKVEQK